MTPISARVNPAVCAIVLAVLSAIPASAQPKSAPMRLTDLICATCHNDPFADDKDDSWGAKPSPEKVTKDILARMKRIHAGTLRWTCTKVELLEYRGKLRMCAEDEWPKLVWEKTPKPPTPTSTSTSTVYRCEERTGTELTPLEFSAGTRVYFLVEGKK